MSKYNIDDTIAALATPVGEASISVIRVSGPEAFQITEAIFVSKAPSKISELESHTVHLGEVRDQNGRGIDQVLVTVFRAPNSYTGEDVVEISCHGGYAITRRILECVYRAGARNAEPGEFTKRAFLSGKLDLTQAEAVVDLIRSKSEQSLQVALNQLGGELSRKFRALREELMKMYAHMEGYLDFPEDDIEVYTDEEFRGRFIRLKAELGQLLAGFRRGALLREGAAAVLVGRPNVGKSSLFNALLARERALVSEFPGTTRDHLEEAIEVGGIYIRLIDTAGLSHDSGNPLDRIGMERTRENIGSAELILFVVDGSEALTDEDRKIFAEIPQEKRILVVINKTDLPSRLDVSKLKELSRRKAVLRASSRTGDGIRQLEAEMVDSLLEGRVSVEGEQITRLRHKTALETALAAITQAEAAFYRKESLEIVILDIKTAVDQLRELIGEIYSEDLLDVVFSEFCIGK